MADGLEDVAVDVQPLGSPNQSSSRGRAPQHRQLPCYTNMEGLQELRHLFPTLYHLTSVAKLSDKFEQFSCGTIETTTIMSTFDTKLKHVVEKGNSCSVSRICIGLLLGSFKTAFLMFTRGRESQ